MTFTSRGPDAGRRVKILAFGGTFSAIRLLMKPTLLRGFCSCRLQRRDDFRERPSAALGRPALGAAATSAPMSASWPGARRRKKGDGSHAPVDSGRIYTLPELIDLAQRNNPENARGLGARARLAAAGVGLSESLYYPYLAASAGAGYERAFIPFPTLAVDLRPVAQQLAAKPAGQPAFPGDAKAAVAERVDRWRWLVWSRTPSPRAWP